MSGNTYLSGFILHPKINKGLKQCTFKVHCPKINQKFRGFVNSACEFRDNDFIRVVCNIQADGQLVLITAPIIIPAADAAAVKSFLVRKYDYLRTFDYRKAEMLYDGLVNLAGNESLVGEWTNNVAQNWADSKNPKILTLFDDIPVVKSVFKAKKLLTDWHYEFNLRPLLVMGLDVKTEIYKIPLKLQAIFKKCGNNPYSLPQIGFAKADLITWSLDTQTLTIENAPASKSPNDDPADKPLTLINNLTQDVTLARNCGILIRAIYMPTQKHAWSCIPIKFLLAKYPAFLDYAPHLTGYGYVRDLDCAYYQPMHTAEVGVANFVVKLMRANTHTYDDVKAKLTNDEAAVDLTIPLSVDQQLAVMGCLTHSICGVIGGAGTGKTSCLTQVIHNLKLRDEPVIICSFTGKAVSRIRELSGVREARTIHSIIARSKSGEENYSNPVTLVMDETSMTTTGLLYDLIQAYPNIKRVILFGDNNQLQPIEWGSFFNELINSETIPVYKLTTNHRVLPNDDPNNPRQDGIILNSRLILQQPINRPVAFQRTSNFIIRQGGQDVVETIAREIKSLGFTAQQLMVITPINETVRELNPKLKAIFNANQPGVTDAWGTTWSVGDKVMLLDNINLLEIYNGEQGVVSRVAADKIFVEMGGGSMETGKVIHEFLLRGTGNQSGWKPSYKGYDADAGKPNTRSLTHAYCITVDKSQGAEAELVIFVLDKLTEGNFNNRNRFYTANTRGKGMMWIVTRSIDYLCRQASKPSPKRIDNLAKRLRSELPQLYPYVEPTVSNVSIGDDMQDDEPPDHFFLDWWAWTGEYVLRNVLRT